MTKIFGGKWLSKNLCWNEIVDLFEVKESTDTASLSGDNYSINYFLHIFPKRIILICMSSPNIYIVFRNNIINIYTLCEVINHGENSKQSSSQGLFSVVS